MCVQSFAKNKDTTTALRDAQVGVIEFRRKTQKGAHPFFWAAFTLTSTDAGGGPVGLKSAAE